MPEVVFRLERNIQELKRIDHELLSVPPLTACERETLDEIYTIIEEILLNVINYGFSGLPESHNVDIRLILLTERNTLTMKFIDNGAPFNPLSKLRTLTQGDDYNQTMSIGGWGINMVRDLSEHLDYKREDEFNIFTVQKKIYKNQE